MISPYQIFVDEEVTTKPAHNSHITQIPAMSVRSHKVLDYVYHNLSARHECQPVYSNLHLRINKLLEQR